MQEENNIVNFNDYKRAKEEKAAFLRSLEYDAISATLQQMGRGPLMPSENVLEVLKGQKMNLSTFGNLPTIRLAGDRLDLKYLVSDILRDLKHPEQYGVSMDERGKILVKTNGMQMESAPLPFIKPEIQQQNNVVSLSDYMQNNQQQNNTANLTQQAPKSSGEWVA